MAFLDKTIDWANYADSTDKVAFLKIFVKNLGGDELNCLRGILSRKRKRVFKKDKSKNKPWKGQRVFTGCKTAVVRSPSVDVTTPGVVVQPEEAAQVEVVAQAEVAAQPEVVLQPAEMEAMDVVQQEEIILPPEPKLPWKQPRMFTCCNTAVVRSPPLGVTPPAVAVQQSEPEMVLLKKPRLNEVHWARSYNREQFVAFDVEACSRFMKFLNNGKMWKPVDVHEPKDASLYEDDPRVPKAAYVSVVDCDLKPLMKNVKVQHLPGTFKVDYYSKVTANIKSTNQLQDGIPFEKVVAEFLEKTSKKFHITCGGGSDYRYLELSPVLFERFDLQSFYQRPSSDNPEKMEPMSLRDIFYYHFRKDCQRGAHDALVDAKATMKIFLEGYCKIDLNDEHNFSDVPKLKKLAEKGKYWCAGKKDFVDYSCKCYSCVNFI